jgi:hypothetical protein
MRTDAVSLREPWAPPRTSIPPLALHASRPLTQGACDFAPRRFEESHDSLSESWAPGLRPRSPTRVCDASRPLTKGGLMRTDAVSLREPWAPPRTSIPPLALHASRPLTQGACDFAPHRFDESRDSRSESWAPGFRRRSPTRVCDASRPLTKGADADRCCFAARTLGRAAHFHTPARAAREPPPGSGGLGADAAHPIVILAKARTPP